MALEMALPLGEMWRKHALYLAMNYYAAASIAVLVFATDGGLNVIGLVVPLLALSYGAYKAVANRIEDADRHVNEVEGLYRATVETLAIAVDAKDQVTHGHIRRVQRHTIAVARALGVSDPLELRALEAASLLHDVGKLAVPDYVLNKPGALTHAEFERMKQHASKGAEILEAVDFPYAVVPIVRHHHEQWNGQGYPDGLAGDRHPVRRARARGRRLLRRGYFRSSRIAARCPTSRASTSCAAAAARCTIRASSTPSSA